MLELVHRLSEWVHWSILPSTFFPSDSGRMIEEEVNAEQEREQYVVVSVFR